MRKVHATRGISGEERMATHLCSAQPAQAVAEWQAPPGYAAKTGLLGLETTGSPLVPRLGLCLKGATYAGEPPVSKAGRRRGLSPWMTVLRNLVNGQPRGLGNRLNCDPEPR